MTALSSDLREALAKVGTSTLTGVLNRRGLRSMTLFDVWPLRPEQPRLVGIAFTMRFIPSREDMDGPNSKNRSTVQPQAMEECPPGHVLMIDSRGDSRAASAGDLYVGRLKARGAAGIVTDGGFRDSPEIAKLPFPAYHAAPAAPTNLIKHHAVDLNVPIACGEVPVYPGDVLVGDDEGVAVIPQHIVDAVAEEAFEQTAFEDFVQEQVAAGRSIFGIYPPAPEAREEFKRWRVAKGR
jgi:regulator of RNase E activity RraA